MAVGEFNINSGNLALWHLNGDFVDAMGGANLSATSTVNSVAGKIGSGCAEFAGGYLSGGPVAIAATDEFSVGCWFKLKTLPAGSGTYNLISRQDGSTRQYQLAIYNAVTEVDLFWGTSVAAGGALNFNPPFTLTTNVWYWAVGTRESAGSGTIRAYLNGVCLGLSTGAGNNGAPTSNTFVGAQGAAGANPIDGKMDEVFIIKQCLTQKKIRDYYAWATGRGSKIL